jgi:hypothetical protein
MRVITRDSHGTGSQSSTVDSLSIRTLGRRHSRSHDMPNEATKSRVVCPAPPRFFPQIWYA